MDKCRVFLLLFVLVLFGLLRGGEGYADYMLAEFCSVPLIVGQRIMHYSAVPSDARELLVRRKKRVRWISLKNI